MSLSKLAKKTPKRQTHDKDTMEQALSDIRSGKLTSTEAAERYGIPSSTLRKHKSGIQSGKLGGGRRTDLTVEEERRIVVTVRELGDVGLPVGMKRLKDLVQEFVASLGRETRFVEGRPSDHWVKLFRKRWSTQLKARRPEALQLARARGLTQAAVDSWFGFLEKFFQELDIENRPAQLFNVDETGFSDDSTRDKVLVSKETKNPYKLQPGTGKDFVTVVCCVSAAGFVVPPYIIFRAKGLYDEWCGSGPPGAGYNTSERGWIDEGLFYDWLANHFLKKIKDVQRPVVLFMDGHGSHVSVRIVEKARENYVHLVVIPPHTSHALQPLDVGVFGPAKAAWRSIVNDFYVETRMSNLNKPAFSMLQNRLFDTAFTKQHCVAGFAKAGIYPLDKTAIPAGKVKVSKAVAASGQDDEDGDSSAVSQSPGPSSQQSPGPASAVTSPSPTKAIQDAIRKTFQRSPLEPANPRRKIHRSAGRCVSTEEALSALRDKEAAKEAAAAAKEAAAAAKEAAAAAKKGKAAAAASSKKGKQLLKRRRVAAMPDSSDSSTSEEEILEDDKCASCTIIYENSDCDWAQCVQCNRWTCYDCLPLAFDPEDDYVCEDCKP